MKMKVKNVEALKLNLNYCMDYGNWEANSIFENHTYLK